MAEVEIPEAKRDMLTIVLKEKETQLKMIIEHQQLRKETVLKVQEEEKKAAEQK